MVTGRTYAILDAATGRQHAQQLIDTLVDCPVPEVAKVGRTLRSWRREYLAYFDTGRTSNGPTEAINLIVEKIRRTGHGYRKLAQLPPPAPTTHCGVQWDRRLTPRDPTAPSTLRDVEPV